MKKELNSIWPMEYKMIAFYVQFSWVVLLVIAFCVTERMIAVKEGID